MKLDVVIGERAAKIELLANALHFSWETAGEISANFCVAELSPGSYSVLIGERSFEVAVASENEVIVDGRSFKVEVFDPREMRGRRSGAGGEGRQQIKALMPGKVVRILVSEGDEVEAGQGLIVVEAMKMQNEMKSPKAGRVAEIKVKPEATVASGEVLLAIE